MVTLVRVKAPGRRARTCSSQCYNAKRPACACVCTGAHHGIGLEQAQERLRQQADELREKLSLLGEVFLQMPLAMG